MPSSSFQNIAPILFFLISPLSALNTVNIPSDVSEPTNSSYSYTNASCTSLLTHANATSSRSFPSRFLGGFDDNSTFPSKTFLLTAAVNEVVNNATNSTGVDTTIWFGTHPDSDLAQDGLSFAACAIIIDGLPLDGIKRGQADDGFCEQTFSDSCINELVERVTGIAIGLAQYAVPGEDGNRTSAMYPDICENIASQLSDKDNVPPACQEFKDEGSGKLWFNYETEPITGSHYAPAFQTCSVADSPAPYIQYPLYNKLTDNDNLKNAYVNATQAVIPVFFLEMPPVNGTAAGSRAASDVNLICLHPSNISSGSETPPALPADSAALGKDYERGAGLALLGALGAGILMIL